MYKQDDFRSKLIDVNQLGQQIKPGSWIFLSSGVANLFGKSTRERVLAMIEIAHPDHRNLVLHSQLINS